MPTIQAVTGIATGIKRQRGMALIVTLVILVAVTLIGLTALRAGFVHVAIATNSQAKAMLFRAAEASAFSLEALVERDKVAAAKATGVLGMLSPGLERTGCLTAKKGFVAATSAASSPCVQGDATSARNLVVAQTTLTMGAGAGAAAPTLTVGSDFARIPGAVSTYTAYSTAVMPSFGDVEQATVFACLQNSANDSADPAGIVTVSECLAAAGAAYTTLVQEYTSGLGEKATN